MKDKLTYISLFSSAGVGCYGFKMEDFECVATCELLEKRLNIQRLNEKCKLESAYILGDIKEEQIKNKIYKEIKKQKNKKIDVVIATPPCQGMSVANHKKANDEIDRNSLIRESVEIIDKIRPNFFIFENVSAFWKTGCMDKFGNVVSIGELIERELGENYIIENRVINFKNYGANSSRTRTVVIGVEKKISNFISPLELYPDYTEEKKLKDVIGNFSKLKWGEYDKTDFYHSFRIYPEHMRDWIRDIKEGESAFDNKEKHKQPHKIINGEIIVNTSKNGDKYKRQQWNKVAPCIHTRNDQMASQNTVHPSEDRVFSIRELMEMMTIPRSFKWINHDFNKLNNLPLEEKRKISKKEEMNIRQSIGEAVPTIIFNQIAKKIKKIIFEKKLEDKEIKKIIENEKLLISENLVNYILKNKNKICLASLSRIIELANSMREKNSAYYTDKFIVQKIIKNLPEIKKEEITIVEPSVGIGNFLPLLFKKYEDIRKVNLILVDIDQEILFLLKKLYDETIVPKNFQIKFINEDFLKLKFEKKVDLIIGNPPFTKIKGEKLKKYLENNYNKNATNLSEFILEKSLEISDNISLIMPKNLLNTEEYSKTRELLEEKNIKKIIDFGEKGFKGVLVETINILVGNTGKNLKIEIESITENIIKNQIKKYIFDKRLPYWIIYRDDFFDNILKNMEFGIFDVFRDRQITNSNSFIGKKKITDIQVIKSRNISDDGNQILKIKNYDTFIDEEELNKFLVKKYKDNDSVYLVPNMTYKPRIMKKEKGYITNGSVAILIPKYKFNFSKKQMKYISSDDFRQFYKIARNYQTRTLNIDKTSSYWFGIYKGSLV